MPRVHHFQTIPEHNLQPPPVDPGDNKSPIDAHRIAKIHREFVNLVHAGSIEGVVGQLEWCGWSKIRHIVDGVT